MNEWESQYLQQWPDDAEYSLYLEAWLAYHKTANLIDGHIKYPRNRDEFELMAKAKFEAAQARDNILRDAGMETHRLNKKKYNDAKCEAVRMLEKVDRDGRGE